MLDSFWAVTLTLCIAMESLALGHLASGVIFARSTTLQKKKPFFRLISFVVGLGLLSQILFAASLTSATKAIHWVLILITTTVCAIQLYYWQRNHTKTTTFLSTVTKRTLASSGAWIALPLIWWVTRTFDALIPHYNARALSLHLLMPKIWHHMGGLLVTPLQPTSAFASLWEALYFHIYSVLNVLQNQNLALVQTQLAAQLTHFWFGQCLCILILWRWIFRILRIHQGSNFGTQARCLFLAWLICANTALPQSATQAQNEWGALAMAFSALHVFMYSRHSGWATFLATTAFLMQPSLWPLGIGFLAAVLADGKRNKYKLRWSMFFAFFAGSASFFYRNYQFSGKFFYPWLEIQSPNWIAPQYWLNTIAVPTSTFIIGPGIRILFILSSVSIPLVILFRLFSKKKFNFLVLFKSKNYTRSQYRRFIFFCYAIFVLVAALLQRRFGFAYFGKSPIAFLIISTTISIVAMQLIFWRAKEWAILWNCIALLSVAIPVHIFWQSHAGVKSNSEYIQRYHHDMDVKNWLSLHIPPNTPILWSQDRDFYYVTQPSVSLAESAIAIASIEQTGITPLQKVELACRMGFRLFAWTEPDPSSPSATFATSAFVNFLKLQNTLFAGHDTSVFDLRPLCKQ